MKYKCSQCNYESTDKSNFNRHMKSATHIQLASKLVINTTKHKDNSGTCICNSCGKEFSHMSSLSRHNIIYIYYI